jgi:hypothetical protein
MKIEATQKQPKKSQLMSFEAAKELKFLSPLMPTSE